jgi:hypothetical protein
LDLDLDWTWIGLGLDLNGFILIKYALLNRP